MLTRLRARRAALPMGTRSRAGRATDRGLRSRRARAATLKATKKKGAGIQKRKRPAGASEAAGKTLSEATEILKLKKEAFGATRLWRQIGVPGALKRCPEGGVQIHRHHHQLTVQQQGYLPERAHVFMLHLDAQN